MIPSETDPIAVITRNSYGSLVLNAARVLFADIDYQQQPAGCLAPEGPGQVVPVRGQRALSCVTCRRGWSWDRSCDWDSAKLGQNQACKYKA